MYSLIAAFSMYKMGVDSLICVPFSVHVNVEFPPKNNAEKLHLNVIRLPIELCPSVSILCFGLFSVLRNSHSTLIYGISSMLSDESKADLALLSIDEIYCMRL